MQSGVIDVDVHVQGEAFTEKLRPQSVFRVIDVGVQKGEMPELPGGVSRVGHFEFSEVARVSNDVKRLRDAQIHVCQAVVGIGVNFFLVGRGGGGDSGHGGDRESSGGRGDNGHSGDRESSGGGGNSGHSGDGESSGGGGRGVHDCLNVANRI